MKNIIRKLFFGDTVIREYSTVTIDGDIDEKVYFETADIIFDVSKNHWVLCLEPIVFGIWLEKKEQVAAVEKRTGYTMYFGDIASDNGKEIKQNAVAVVKLDLFDKIEEREGTLFLLKLQNNRIYHTGFIKTKLLFQKYYKKPGLSFTKLKSFVSAYSYPRRVRIISFRQGDYYNIFPMDLLGDIGSHKRFVFGLRHTNVTLNRIIETGKLAVSEVSYEYKNIIYDLGKHHGSSPPPLEKLPFKVLQSRQFGFYIPAWVDSYKEIRIVKTINLGSHMLMWGECIDEEILKEPSPHLFHIHFLLYLHQKKRGFTYTEI